MVCTASTPAPRTAPSSALSAATAAATACRPAGSTIDYELSKVLPETLLPHLCIGMDSMENMTAKPTVANLSASGAGQPIFMHSNPNHLLPDALRRHFQGDIRKQHEARPACSTVSSNWLRPRAEPCRRGQTALTANTFRVQ